MTHLDNEALFVKTVNSLIQGIQSLVELDTQQAEDALNIILHTCPWKDKEALETALCGLLRLSDTFTGYVNQSAKKEHEEITNKKLN